MAEWFENYAENLGPFGVAGDETGAKDAHFIKRALHLRKGQSVLDAPCGTGRVSYHLAQAGCRVTSADLTPSYIDHARTRFRKEGLEGAFQVADMREIDFAACFHGVVLWGGSFGFFSDEENQEVVRRYARALRPGGRLLVDSIHREWVLRHFQSTRKQGDLTVRNKWDAATQRSISTWTVRQVDKRTRTTMRIRLYTPGQLAELFERAGLTVKARYGSKAGETFTRRSPRLILVGRKEEQK